MTNSFNQRENHQLAVLKKRTKCSPFVHLLAFGAGEFWEKRRRRLADKETMMVMTVPILACDASAQTYWADGCLAGQGLD